MSLSFVELRSVKAIYPNFKYREATNEMGEQRSGFRITFLLLISHARIEASTHSFLFPLFLLFLLLTDGVNLPNNKAIGLPVQMGKERKGQNIEEGRRNLDAEVGNREFLGKDRSKSRRNVVKYFFYLVVRSFLSLLGSIIPFCFALVLSLLSC